MNKLKVAIAIGLAIVGAYLITWVIAKLITGVFYLIFAIVVLLLALPLYKYIKNKILK